VHGIADTSFVTNATMVVSVVLRPSLKLITPLLSSASTEMISLVDVEDPCLMHIHGHTTLKINVLNNASEYSFSFD